jgi:hypothetical protein
MRQLPPESPPPVGEGDREAVEGAAAATKRAARVTPDGPAFDPALMRPALTSP